MPESIAAQPQPREDLEFFFDAYLVLSSTRQASGFGPTPLPWQHVLAYAREYGYADVDDFVAIIMGVDAGFIADVNEANRTEGAT